MNTTKTNLADALLMMSEYSRTHCIADIDPEGLKTLYEQYWDWHSQASALCDAWETTLDDLALYSGTEPEWCYVGSRLRAGSGLWDQYANGAEPHNLAIKQGSLEGLFDNDGELLIA